VSTTRVHQLRVDYRKEKAPEQQGTYSHSSYNLKDMVNLSVI
jgi:hypothetical protein